MANPFVHVELQSQDVAKSKEFYGALFDWKLEDMHMQDSEDPYTLIQVGEGTAGGMMKHPIPEAPSMWMPYMNVDDVIDATKRAESLGGVVVRDKTEVPDMGWFSIIQDPTGAVFGLWQDKNKT